MVSSLVCAFVVCITEEWCNGLGHLTTLFLNRESEANFSPRLKHGFVRRWIWKGFSEGLLPN